MSWARQYNKPGNTPGAKLRTKARARHSAEQDACANSIQERVQITESAAMEAMHNVHILLHDGSDKEQQQAEAVACPAVCADRDAKALLENAVVPPLLVGNEIRRREHVAQERTTKKERIVKAKYEQEKQERSRAQGQWWSDDISRAGRQLDMRQARIRSERDCMGTDARGTSSTFFANIG